MKSHLPPHEIRAATAADAPDVAAAHAASWAAGYADIVPFPLIAEMVKQRCSVKKWSNELGGSEGIGTRTHLAVSAHTVLGFIQFGPSENDPSIGQIIRCYLRPESRGSGIASTLMSSALAPLRQVGFSEVIVWTAATPRSRSFYERFQFRETGKLRQSTSYGVDVTERQFKNVITGEASNL